MTFATFTFGDDAAETTRRLARWQFTAAMVRWADRTAAPAVLAAVRAETPVRTGAMRDAWRYQRQTSAGQVEMSLTNRQPYAHYVIGGTRPHEIVPRTDGGVLHWTNDAGEHFARRVWHPGTQPNPIPERAWARVRPFIDASFKAMIREATQ